MTLCSVFYDSRHSNRELRSNARSSFHILGGKYKILNGHVGRVDGSAVIDAILNVYGDETLLHTLHLTAADLHVPISISVEGVMVLRLELVHVRESDFDNIQYAFKGSAE